VPGCPSSVDDLYYTGLVVVSASSPGASLDQLDASDGIRILFGILRLREITKLEYKRDRQRGEASETFLAA